MLWQQPWQPHKSHDSNSNMGDKKCERVEDKKKLMILGPEKLWELIMEKIIESIHFVVGRCLQ